MDELDKILDKFDALYKDSLNDAKKKEENINTSISRLRTLLSLLSDQQDLCLTDEEKQSYFEKSLIYLDLLEDFLSLYVEENDTNQHLAYTLLSILKLSSNDQAYNRIHSYFSKYNKKISKKSNDFSKKWESTLIINKN
jgi:hypothetical protein